MEQCHKNDICLLQPWCPPSPLQLTYFMDKPIHWIFSTKILDGLYWKWAHWNSSLFFLIFYFIITLICGITDHYCIMEKKFKKSGKNKNNLKTIYPKNHENLKNTKPRVQFHLFLWKKSAVLNNNYLHWTFEIKWPNAHT